LFGSVSTLNEPDPPQDEAFACALEAQNAVGRGALVPALPERFHHHQLDEVKKNNEQPRFLGVFFGAIKEVSMEKMSVLCMRCFVGFNSCSTIDPYF